MALPENTTQVIHQTALDSKNRSPFVRAENGSFFLNDQIHRFVGANFWQGMNLSMASAPGNRPQLLRELDTLQSLGVTNLRVLAASEGPDQEPYRVVPALMTRPGEYNETVFDGLDFLLAEMGKRAMKAVMLLNNYWFWSGGMAQYVSWKKKTAIPYPGDWQAYIDYTKEFYAIPECQEWYRNHIQSVLTRKNPYNGLVYSDDPAIFAWELANEPRRYPYEWIDQTAAYIKSIDPNHMVTTGSEGTPPGETLDFKRTHGSKHIDYVTIHVWPQNWMWFDPQKPSSYETAKNKALAYLREHAAYASDLKKPLVLEEFGMPRDTQTGNIYDPQANIRYRNLLYKAFYDEMTTLQQQGVPVGGDNFWAWAGAARPGNSMVGDPPHEPAGWYSVYDQDRSTLEIIRAHAVEFSSRH